MRHTAVKLGRPLLNLATEPTTYLHRTIRQLSTRPSAIKEGLRLSKSEPVSSSKKLVGSRHVNLSGYRAYSKSHYNSHGSRGSGGTSPPRGDYAIPIALVGASILTTFLLASALKKEALSEESKVEDPKTQTLPSFKPIPGLKSYTREEVAAEADSTGRIIVSLDEAVFDVTDYVERHPGGKFILLAKGKGLEEFRSVERHHLKPEVYEILAEYRIGNLTNPTPFSFETDAYATDPTRSLIGLHFHSLRPFNADPEDFERSDTGLTGVDDVFVRNHGPVPVIAVEDYTLTMETDGKTETLSEADLFDPDGAYAFAHKTELVLACAGQRRNPGQNGSVWRHANAIIEPSGTQLIPFFEASGVDVSKAKPTDYLFIEGKDGYTSCIPLSEIPKNSLIANKMNGEPLSRDHGGPARFFFPGYAGHFQIKWATKARIAHDVTPSNIAEKYTILSRHKGSYLIKQRETGGADLKTVANADVLPVQSLFYTDNLREVSKGTQSDTFKGYAYCGASDIQRVEISVDGRRWQTASILPPRNSDAHWVEWNATIRMEELAPGAHQIFCRATTVTGLSQPQAATENARGLFNNQWAKAEFEIPNS